MDNKLREGNLNSIVCFNSVKDGNPICKCQSNEEIPEVIYNNEIKRWHLFGFYDYTSKIWN